MQSAKKHTNRLIDESSPYLQQHAHNPVDWYPWGDEAFERAKAEDKPVLVSIGYSACHWCHVMEHESFEDEAAAKLMNENFVNIKVDMEERPDVDQIYMTFVQLTTGRGGWPMNVFLTPEKLPFFGGTYFPPSPRYGMPSWTQILHSISEAWLERREELLHSANDILGELRRVGMAGSGAESVSEELADTAFSGFERSFDARNGGFGGAPKFPAAMSMEFLLRYWKRTGNENALTMVRRTAEQMARGGIYDQLGGGFHRYSVDAVWLVPHFEKMLYDNAQLVRVYLHLFQITGEDLFKDIATETLEYVLREMTGSEGGFYSTQDADSEGEEGKFFVWSPEEIVSILGEEAARAFCLYYDVNEEGNFEGRSILNIKSSLREVAEALKIDPDDLRTSLIASKQKLFAEREKRIKPFRDEKVLTAWNGLMLAAFAEAAALFDNEEYLGIARRNADFLLANLVSEDRVLRTWKDGTAKLNGYIEDYANLADGLLELYQVSGEVRYFSEARKLAETMIAEFWDESTGGFFFTSNDHEELIVRNKDLTDNATPSGNSVAADVLLRLARLTGDERYERYATTVLRLAAGQIRRFPSGFGRALGVVEFSLVPTREVAIIGPRGNALEKELWKKYLPSKVVALSDTPASDAEQVPLLIGRELRDGQPSAFVCENFVCGLPVTDTDGLRRVLAGEQV